jgi:hypothetical protein
MQHVRGCIAHQSCTDYAVATVISPTTSSNHQHKLTACPLRSICFPSGLWRMAHRNVSLVSDTGVPLNAAGSGIDIWHGAGPSANSSKRFRSLHPSGRAANRDWPLSTPDRRLWFVESDFRTSGSTSRVDRTSATDVPFCAVGWMAMPVVLARRSVVGRRREIADSGAFGGTHSTGCRARF